MRRTFAWQGLDAPRFEIAHVELEDDRLAARGTQLGADPFPYRLDYELRTGAGYVAELLAVEVASADWTRSIELRRGRKPFVDDVLDPDIEFSPLFNSLPVLRHRIHDRPAASHDFTMAFVEVPGLDVRASQQRYLALERRLVRYRAGHFSAELEFDDEGFVTTYRGMAERVGSG